MTSKRKRYSGKRHDNGDLGIMQSSVVEVRFGSVRDTFCSNSNAVVRTFSTFVEPQTGPAVEPRFGSKEVRFMVRTKFEPRTVCSIPNEVYIVQSD